MSDPMVERKPWAEFQAAGLVWWVNRFLHLFGWSIVVELDEAGEVKEVYPAHCRCRGFCEDSETKGFSKLTVHMESDMARIKRDVNVEEEGS